jgi:DNA gyrase subunit A
VLREELLALAEKYGDDRRTEIQEVEDELDIEDLIEEEDCIYTLSEAGYIKRMPSDTYKAQHRGGRGISAAALKEADCVKSLFAASTHDFLLFFTNMGRVHRRKGYQIPEASRTARGTAIVNVLPLEPDERVTAMVLTREFSDEEYLMMVTRSGTVKRLVLSSINTARKAGIRALTLDEGDELISVFKTNGEDKVIIATHDGRAICFAEDDVRPMGRDATGVRGIRLKEGDYVIGAELYHAGATLLTVTENGYGKRTAVEEYLRGDSGVPQGRGGSGMKNYNITAKTGKVAGICTVTDDDDVMLIESGGVMIRTHAADIGTYSRTVQGVIVMRVEEGSQVIGVVQVAREDDKDDSEPTDSTEE